MTSATNTKNSLRIGVFENGTVSGNGLNFNISNTQGVYPPVTEKANLTNSTAIEFTIDFNIFTEKIDASWQPKTPTFENVILYISAKEEKGTSSADVEFWLNDFTLTEIFE